MKKLKKSEEKIRMYNKVVLEDTVLVEYGKNTCGSSLHADDKGCGTAFGGASCYPQGNCTQIP